MEDYLIWIIVIIVAGIVEAASMNLISIWFIPSGFITMLLSFTGMPLWAQILIFILLSTLSLIFIYPWAKNKLKLGKTKTNYEAVIGKIGIVIMDIDNMKAVGQVKVDGQVWTARTAIDDVLIKEGEEVRVLEVKGVKLIVERIEEA